MRVEEAFLLRTSTPSAKPTTLDNLRAYRCPTVPLHFRAHAHADAVRCCGAYLPRTRLETSRQGRPECRMGFHRRTHP